MADFLSPRIRARARAFQAINPSVEEGDSASTIPRSHVGHKRKSSNGDLLDQPELGDAIGGLIIGDTSSVLRVPIRLRYEYGRKWTLVVLLLCSSAALVALALRHTLHVVGKFPDQRSNGPELQAPGDEDSRANVSKHFAQGDATLSRGDADPKREENCTFEVGKTTRARSAETPTIEPLRRYPMIDRSILAKFGGLDPNGLPGERELDEGEDTVELETSPEIPNTSRRFPTILHIPEGRASQKGQISSSRKTSASSHIDPPTLCGAGHPSGRACRFLFPLRVAEQESKARIHFTQVAELARRLNRILVLPNVGKSRMGACYKYPFETYYDTSLFFNSTEHVGAGYVRLDDFRLWSEAQKTPVRSRLLSIASSVTQEVLDTAEDATEECLDDTNADFTIYRYPTEFARETEFPGCFPSKWTHLELEEMSMFVAMDSQGSSVVTPLELGEILAGNINGTAAEMPTQLFPFGSDNEQEPLKDVNAEKSDADVLILNWDLRRPVFPPGPSDISLQYSPELQDLATKLAPSSPYLAIHWRMETVDANVLEDCAHALVDVLSNILHDTGHLGLGVKQVWFASDYPHPVASLSDGSRVSSPAASVAKSGTFRTFGEHHDGAARIFASAFRDGEDLDRWELVDISGAALTHSALVENGDLLKDAGALGILDKTIVSRANLFVSGSKRCSRSSSFTRQIIESRQANWKELRNVVSVF